MKCVRKTEKEVFETRTETKVVDTGVCKIEGIKADSTILVTKEIPIIETITETETI